VIQAFGRGGEPCHKRIQKENELGNVKKHWVFTTKNKRLCADNTGQSLGKSPNEGPGQVRSTERVSQVIPVVSQFFQFTEKGKHNHDNKCD